MKNVIITGCSSGFGLLMTKQLATEGHTVYATMRNIKTTNQHAAAELALWGKQNNVNIFVYELDVNNEESVKAAVESIATHCNDKIDVLINNAGLGTVGLLEEYTDKELQDIFETMVFGPNRVIKAVLSYMHQNRSGLLILISSRMSAFQLPFMGAYSASKAAIHAIAKNYNYELKHAGIDSVIVQAGSFKTDISTKYMAVESRALAGNYGSWYANARDKIIRLFTTYNQPQDTSLITNAVSEIIATPFGKRKIVYPVGVGKLEVPINEINSRSEDMSDELMQNIGI
ncbi:MAG: SDR family NAD(P)-dependent oxidoreductase [Mucilaginibacter sp.]|uniref:SDR family NAD(P)-dependent oxidoreductase n=1 Tax=Mucilaginibacter sp. TaxID=1882438 RepID=UPI0031A50DDC